jgi:hypothetical protein
MPLISRGFRGRRSEGPPDRIPPGQHLVDDFPVLSAGPTPHTPLEQWTFRIEGGAEPVSWTWEEFTALPSEEVTADIHCVTKWSKLDTVWRGVSLDTLLERAEHDASYLTAFCDGGYTTNLPLEHVIDGKAWVAYDYDGELQRLAIEASTVRVEHEAGVDIGAFASQLERQRPALAADVAEPPHLFAVLDHLRSASACRLGDHLEDQRDKCPWIVRRC